MSTESMLHEIAHHLCEERPPHGPEFVATFWVSPLVWWGFGNRADGAGPDVGCVVDGVGVGHRVVVSELPTK